MLMRTSLFLFQVSSVLNFLFLNAWFVRQMVLAALRLCNNEDVISDHH